MPAVELSTAFAVGFIIQTPVAFIFFLFQLPQNVPTVGKVQGNVPKKEQILIEIKH